MGVWDPLGQNITMGINSAIENWLARKREAEQKRQFQEQMEFAKLSSAEQNKRLRDELNERIRHNKALEKIDIMNAKNIEKRYNSQNSKKTGTAKEENLGDIIDKKGNLLPEMILKYTANRLGVIKFEPYFINKDGTINKDKIRQVAVAISSYTGHNDRYDEVYNVLYNYLTNYYNIQEDVDAVSGASKQKINDEGNSNTYSPVGRPINPIPQKTSSGIIQRGGRRGLGITSRPLLKKKKKNEHGATGSW